MRTRHVLSVFLLLASIGAQAGELLVFAAASLKPALDTIIATPQAKAIGNIKVSYAASSQLARQIEHGAPASLFISADQEWMNVMEQYGFVEDGTRIDLLRNVLVLIAPAESELSLTIRKGFPLAAALGDSDRLAIAEPNSVPAGRYAKSALETLSVWSDVKERIVSADNVRAALNFVVRKDAALGIVYRSDVTFEPAVRVVDTFAAASHAPVVYPAAVLKGSNSESARRLLQVLQSAQAQSIFLRYGFDVPRP